MPAEGFAFDADSYAALDGERKTLQVETEGLRKRAKRKRETYWSCEGVRRRCRAVVGERENARRDELDASEARLRDVQD